LLKRKREGIAKKFSFPPHGRVREGLMNYTFECMAINPSLPLHSFDKLRMTTGPLPREGMEP
jgi:hypothetical protein